jgi:hypothetical protein
MEAMSGHGDEPQPPKKQRSISILFMLDLDRHLKAIFGVPATRCAGRMQGRVLRR